MVTRLVILTVVLFITANSQIAYGTPAKYDAEDGYHQYINWSGYASRAATSRYPGSSMVDFLYIGCKAKSYSNRHFIYKFWMRDHADEFGVYVTLDINNTDQKAHVVKIERTDVLIPSYGKWGRYAKETTQEHFPKWTIVSYSPFGCKFVKGNIAEQRFRLWLKNDTENNLMQLTIHYNIDTEEVFDVKYKHLRSF